MVVKGFAQCRNEAGKNSIAGGLWLLFLALTVAATCATPSAIYAQRTTEINSILNKFVSYRYSSVSVFRFRDDDGSVQGLNILLGPKEPELGDLPKQSRKKDELESAVLDPSSVEESELTKLLRDPSNKAYYKYYSEKVEWERKQFKKAFVVTERFRRGEKPKIIALLTQKTTESYYGLEQDVNPPSEIILPNQLRKTAAPLSSSAATLYDYLVNQIIQENVENVTSEAQGLDGTTTYIRKKYGVTNLVDGDNIQQYMRISEGQPKDYRTGGDELTLGFLDVIRFRHFEQERDENGEIKDSAYNKSLPKYGVELRYGLEEINYPSLISERVNLNVMWQSYKLGVILPTSGWAQLSKDVFNIDRTMTNAGFGVNAGFTFPMKIVNQSGVFDFNGSFVFGDGKFNNPVLFLENNSTNNVAFLPRMHLQGHYSFAINIDETSFFRFKLGGTYYSMERWIQEKSLDRETGDTVTNVVQPGFKPSENIGGISGKVEYMALSNTVPWGAGLQFFDGTLLSNVWLQLPFSDQFSIKGDARMFNTLLRDPKLWERRSFFIPSLQFIVTF